MILTHCPFEPTPDSADWDPKSKGSKTYKGNTKYFGDMVTYMDKIVGKIIDKLDSLGLDNDTLLLFVGDNGTDVPVVSMMDGRKVPGAKSKTTDGGTRVPLIANWPGVIPAASQCWDMVDFSDFVPTLCNAAGLPVPETAVDGRSFWPQLQGKKGNPRNWIYCWYSKNGGTSGLKEFARNQRYKLYRTGQFYDIESDVLEKHDLAGSSLDDRASSSYKILKAVLDRYLDARPKHLLLQKNNKKAK